ncbi:MAG: YhdP family protein [Leptothrix sp. (in: b-proteobacteria)]
MPSVSLSPAWWTRLLRLSGRGLRWCAGLLAGGASILLAAWLTLQWGILPRLELWRPQIETWCSDTLGLPVRIATIEVESDLWAPTLTLRQLQINDAEGRPALQLAQLRARLVPGSLLPRALTHWEPTFAELQIDAPELVLRRDRSGQLWVAGLAIAPPEPAVTEPAGSPTSHMPRALQWLLRQGLVQVQGARLDWIDERRSAPPLHLDALNLTLRRRPLGHALQIDAVLPPDWRTDAPDGQHSDGHLQLQGGWSRPLLSSTGLVSIDDWRRWQASLTLSLPGTDLQQLRRYIDLPLQIDQGQLALQAELTLAQGRLERVQADTSVQNLRLQWQPDLAPLALQRLSTHLDLSRAGRSFLLALQPLQWRDAEGHDTPASDLSLQLDRDGQGAVSGGQLRLARLDLAQLGQLASRLPLGTPQRQWLTELAPQGQLQTLQYRWTGPYATPTSYQADGELQGLGLRAQPVTAALLASATPGRPGLNNASLSFSLDAGGGQAKLHLDHGMLEFPGVFEQPRVALQQLDLPLRWRLQRRDNEPLAVQVDVTRARFANTDAAGEFNGHWRTGTGRGYLPGVLDLQVQLSRAEAVQVHRYLPLALPAATRRYVQEAVQAGQARRVEARVRGDLRDFPYSRAGSGEFRLLAEIDAGRLAYVPAPDGLPPAWPLLTDIHGELLFEGNSMTLRRASARLGELGSRHFELQDVQGRIADFAQHPTLQISGQGHGPLPDLLAFVHASPVGGWLAGALDAARGSGPAGLQLALDLPFDDLLHSQVRGKVQLDGNELQLRPDTPALSALRADINFSQAGFSLGNASAQTLGGRLNFGGGLQSDGRLHFSGTGSASADGLRSAPAIPDELRRLASQLNGMAPYQLELGFVDGQPEIQVSSSLLGMAAAWPAPLGKTAAEARPLSVKLEPQSAGPGNAPRMQWQVRLGTVLDLQWLQEDRDGQTRLLHGGIGLGSPAPQPAAGLHASVSWPEVRLDDWLRWFDTLPPSPATPVTSAAAPIATGSATLDTSLLPEHIDIHTARLALPGLALTQVQASLQRDTQAGPQRWHADLSADQLAGQLSIDLPGVAAPGAATRVHARLSRLTLPSAEPAQPGPSHGKSTDTPAHAASTRPTLPALDIAVQALEWQGHALGRLELQAGPAQDAASHAGATADWRISQLTLSHPAAELSASGLWSERAGSAPGRTALVWRVNLHDGGALLAQFGQAGVLRGGQGTLNGQLSWQDAPWSPDLASLAGQVRIALGRGQLLQADPGAARLFGAFSLQSLPRRLLFDFRDITQQGFSFDSIDGTLRIVEGVAHTEHLQVQGVQAAVVIDGSADLRRRSQDLHVRVVPDLNAGTAALAYAVVNPVLGLGTLLGQWVLQKPLADAVAREFHITGRFDQPQINALNPDPWPDESTAPALTGALPALPSAPLTLPKAPP